MSNLEISIAAFYDRDYTQALKLLRPLAEQGNSEAQCLIANMYHFGLGVERNILEAIKWYIKSSNQGYSVASNNLATIYLMGDDGIAASQHEADRWLQKAKEQGFLHIPLTTEYLSKVEVASIQNE